MCLSIPLPLQDSTFEFEKRRNKPVKYDRELMGATIRAMKRVAEIQSARDARHYKKRMDLVKDKVKAARSAEIAEHIDLIAPAAVREKQEFNIAEKVKLAAGQEKKAAAVVAGASSSAAAAKKGGKAKGGAGAAGMALED